MCYPRAYLWLIPSLLSAGLLGCRGVDMLNTHEHVVASLSSMARQAAKDDRQFGEHVSPVVPDSVIKALSSTRSPDKGRHWKRFDISVNEMPVQQFMSHLSSLDTVNILVSPKVTGTVTLNLNQVTLPEVLDAVSDSYGFQIEHKSFGYKVVPQGVETRIYTVDWLALSRSGSSHMNINDLQGKNGSGDKSSNGASSEVKTTFGVKDYELEVTQAIEEIIRANGVSKKSKKEDTDEGVSLNKANGLLVVRASHTAQKLVKKYLRSLHAINSKQVVIDARIVEVNLTKDQEIGISELGMPFVKWTNSGSGSSLNYAQDTSSPKDFSNIINTLSTVGHVSVLSSPRVSILNNQKALIKVGEDEYYSLGGTTSYLSSTAGTVDPVTSSDMQSFFSGIALDVTPQVSKDNIVTMHVHPIVSEVTSVDTEVGGKTTSLPKTKIRETDTIVSARSGQVIVIGGLISESTNLTRNKVPGLESKTLNSHRKDRYYKKELFILLRARVVMNKSWVNELDDVAAHLQDSDHET